MAYMGTIQTCHMAGKAREMARNVQARKCKHTFVTIHSFLVLDDYISAYSKVEIFTIVVGIRVVWYGPRYGTLR
eukprot:c14276_g3_i1 orf=27-248(+)